MSLDDRVCPAVSYIEEEDDRDVGQNSRKNGLECVNDA